MRTIHTLLLVLFTALAAAPLHAQQIGSIGEWRDHFSYVRSLSVVEGGNSIYCASSTGAFRFDRTTEEIQRLTKVNALSDVGINGLAWNESLGMLLVYYSNGNLDLVRGSSSFNMSDIKRSSVIGNKAVNSITFDGTRAYLACGFGIVVVDLERREVRDTWFIGPSGSQVNVNQVAFSTDSIYAATNTGLFVASRTAPNLAAFNNWRRRVDMGQTISQGPFNAVVRFNDRMLLNYKRNVANSDTLLVLQEDNSWQRVQSLYGRENISVRVSHDQQFLVVTHPGDVQLLDQGFQEVNYAYGYTPQGSSPNQAIFASDGLFWIADRSNGLIRTPGGSTGREILPNGPRSSSAFRMDMSQGSLFVATGAVTGNWSNTYSKEGIHHFANDTWATSNPDNTPLLQGANTYAGTTNDIMIVAVDPKDPARAFAGSWEEGLIEFRDRVPIAIHHVTNSSLGAPVSGPADKVNVAGLDFDKDGNLWITNAHSTTPLSVLTRNGQWQAFDPGGLLAGNYLVADVLAARNGFKWIIRPRGNALLVFNDNGTITNTDDDQYRLLRNIPGQGGLPSPDVYCIAEDLDGEIWVGTNKGVAVFYSPDNIFSNGDYDAQQILILQDGNYQLLLETEAVSAIAVDGADRKWIGTQTSGVFLISADGREQIHHFTAENSPLPSNGITSLAIDERTGEVFIGTERGIISYRSDATGGGFEAECASVFPNPVRQDHTGPIAITGLVRDSEVKVTDVAGNLVYRTTSLGGQAIWYGNDMSGNRVSTGVYLIFATDRSGSYKCNTKVLVVR
jgi:hypothetical protein